MNFPLNAIVFGAIVLLMILILSYDLRNTKNNAKCQYKNNCGYPYCDCFKNFKNEV